MKDDLLRKIEELQQRRFTTWKSIKVDDYIIGTCVDIKDVTKPEDPHRKVVILIDADEVVSDGEKLEAGLYGVWETCVLKRKMQEKLPMNGDRIGIRFDGYFEGKKKKMKRFGVQVASPNVSGGGYEGKSA